MTTEKVIKQIAGGDAQDGGAVEPEVHACGVGRPEAGPDPLDEPSVHRGLVDDMDHVRREEGPHKNVEIHDSTPARSLSRMIRYGGIAINSRFCSSSSVQPSSWTRRWCLRQSRTRLSRVVGPPSAQCLTWCESVHAGGQSQPGNLQLLSRATSARRVGPGTTRLVWSASPSMMGVIAASQAKRRAVSAGMGCDHSSSAAIEPGSLLRVAMSTLIATCGFWPP